METIRILVTGDRNWKNASFIWDVLDSFVRHFGKERVLFIQGGAIGADTAAKTFCEKYRIDYVTRYAHWDVYSLKAGPIRNRVQFDEHPPHWVLAFHPNIDKSKGTKHMVSYARQNGCPKIRIFTGEEDLRDGFVVS